METSSGITQGIVTLQGNPTPIPASLSVTATHVEARAANGDVLTLPLATLVVTPGGFDGDFIFLRDAEGHITLSTTDLSLLERMVEVGGEAMATRLQHVRKHRASASFWRNVSMGVAGFIALALLMLMFAAPALLSASIDMLPVSIDRSVGDASSESFGPAITDARVVALADAIVARLRETNPNSPHTYRVRVVQNEDVNALAMPGGSIVIFSGLILHAENAEQIAGVLAHEMAHVERRHGLRNVAHSAGLMIAMRLLIAAFIGDVDGFTSLATDVSALALVNQYNQDQESEADSDAVQHMHQAGLDPSALASFFRMMAREGIGEAPLALAWLSTHPDHEARVSAIEAQVRDLPPLVPRPLDAGFSDAQAALR